MGSFSQPSLFEESAFRSRLAGRLRRLAEQNIWIGTSSWKYEGWLGQIYTPQRYFYRGKLSKKKFEAECLAEYAETFPIVCGDFSFYQFPAENFWRKLFASAPASLRYGFKVPEEITCKAFPAHARYGPRAGRPNENFLNPQLFRAAFLDLLAPYRDRIPVLIFEFGTFSKKSYEQPEHFLGDLDRFLDALPNDFRYSVEIRNPEYLIPDYFELLRLHGVAHAFNAWTRMPDLGTQIEIPGAFTTGFSVTRALLRRGRPYEKAVCEFTPYAEVKDENPEARAALRALIAKAKQHRQEAYIFVNNRLEGNAPSTIDAVAAG